MDDELFDDIDPGRYEDVAIRYVEEATLVEEWEDIAESRTTFQERVETAMDDLDIVTVNQTTYTVDTGMNEALVREAAIYYEEDT